MDIKLLMNSMHGETTIKPVETDTIVKDNRNDFEKYVSYNHNCTDSVIEVSERSCIKNVEKTYIIFIMYIVVLRF